MRITIKSKAIDYKLLIGSFLLSVVPLASFAQNRSDNLTKSLREHVEVLASQDLKALSWHGRRSNRLFLHR